MSDAITIRTLTDGGQSAAEIAEAVAEFIDGAKRTLELAQYDFNLLPETAEIVTGALRRAHDRGVYVRFAYNLDHRNPIPVPPPPEPDVTLLAALPIVSKPVAGVPDLMHHKYVIRDGEGVWTGSLNWTDDSWSRQENVVAVVRSPELAQRFGEDFEQLWSTGDVERSGFVDTAPITVGATQVRPWFTPGHGEDLSHRIARAIGRAKQRVRICSPVITTGPVLGTLAQAITDGRLDLAGCIDQTQIRGVVYQWSMNGQSSWKLPLLRQVMAGPFTGKLSTPYAAAGSLHDFMHAKVTVADDVVFIGSFNLSRSGESNAENVVELHDAELADRLAGFVDDVRNRYPRVDLAPGQPS